MPDVTLVIRGLADADGAARLEGTLGGLDAVRLVNADAERGVVAVSYEGGGEELEEIEGALREAGYEVEPSPGARRVEED